MITHELETLKTQVQTLHYDLQYHEAIALAEKMVEAARVQQDRAMESTAHIAIFDVYYALSEYDNAVQHIERAITLAEDAEDNALYAEALANYAAYDLHVKEDLESANRKATLAITAAYNADNSRVEALARTVYAGVLFRQGKHSRVIPEQKHALQLAETSDDKQIMATIVNNIGNYYVTMRQTAKARGYFERALTLIQEAGDKSTAAIIRVNLALTYLNSFVPGAFKKGEALTEEALNFARDHDLRTNLVAALQLMAQVFTMKGDYEQAIAYYRESVDMAKVRDDGNFARAGLISMGNICLRIRDYAQAFEVFQEMIALGTPRTQTLVIGHIQAAHVALLMRRPSLAFGHYRAAMREARYLTTAIKVYVWGSMIFRYLEATPRLLFGLVLRRPRTETAS